MSAVMNTERCVIAVAETHSQSKAAELLGISQAAVSQQIKKAEAQIGAPLFIRHNKLLVLTDAGKIYLNGARASLSIYNAALRDIRKISTRNHRQITFVYNNGLLNDIPAVLADFRALHPDVYVNTIYGTATSALDYLSNGIADFAVTATRDFSSSLLGYLPLRDDEMVLALPYGHPLAHKFRQHGVNFHLLQGELFILQQYGSFFNNYAHAVFQENQFNPDRFIEVSEISSVIEMIHNKQGIGFVPARFPSKGRYLSFSLQPPASYHLAIAYLNRNHLSPLVRELMIQLLQQYDQYNQ